MSVKCTRDQQNEDSSFSIAVYPACPRATPTAPAPARAAPGDAAGHVCPAPATRAPDARGTPARPRRPWGAPGGSTLPAEGTAARTLRCKKKKLHSQKSSAKNFQLKNTADCEIMFQITKNTVLNKNNLNSFMNPFYFKSLFYCLLMLQFSSSTFY